MATETNTSEVVVDTMDVEFSFTMIPAHLFLGLLVVAGSLGNIIVIIVYWRKFNPSPNRIFILALAAVDFFTCIVAMPGDIIDLRHNYGYPSAWLCRFDSVVTTFCGLTSGNILLVVGIHRYRKICRPQLTQIGQGMAKKLVVFCFLLCAIFTWPAGVLYGLQTVQTPLVNVTGKACTIDDQFVDTWYPLIYGSLLFLVFCGALTGLITLYALIWLKVKKSTKRLQRSSMNNSVVLTQTMNISSDNLADKKRPFFSQPITREASTREHIRSLSFQHPEEETDNEIDNHQTSDFSMEQTDFSDTELPVEPPKHLEEENVKSKISLINSDNTLLVEGDNSRDNKPNRKFTIISTKSTTSKSSSGRRASRKLTFMMFLISLVFVLSYLPHLVLITVRELNTQLFEGHSGPAVVTYHFFLRSFYIQSVANPIIYGIYNTDFRRACAGLCKGGICCRERDSRRKSRSIFHQALPSARLSLSQTHSSE